MRVLGERKRLPTHKYDDHKLEGMQLRIVMLALY